MNVATGLTKTSRKTQRLAAACVGAVTLAASLSANAAFVISDGAMQDLAIPGNDFNGDLIGKGFNKMTTGAQLSVDMDGSVTFYYIAAESGYTNSFNSGSSNSMTENNDGFDWDGMDSFSIDVTSGDVLDFSFTSATARALTPVDNASDTNLYGLGIMASTMTMDLVLAYNDNPRFSGTGMDGDFDDMLVRAVFSSGDLPPEVLPPEVPVPAAVWLFGSGLLGLMGVARRRKR